MLEHLFANDYNLSSLKKIRPKGHDFDFWATPRFKENYVNQAYESYSSRIIENFAKGADTFIDIGAHYGFFSLLVKNSNPKINIVAFEPEENNFQVLKKNLSEHDLNTNTNLYQVALSDHNTQRDFYISSASDNCSIYKFSNAPILKTVNLQTRTLDEFISDKTLNSVLIKIDTDGSELEILKGAKKVLNKSKRVRLIIEFNIPVLLKRNLDPKLFLEELDKIGFATYLIDEKLGRHYFLESSKFKDWKKYVPLTKQGEIGPISQVNIVCVPKAEAIGACFFSHSATLQGAERNLLEVIQEFSQEYGLLTTTIIPDLPGPLHKEIAKVGGASLFCGISWWCTVPKEGVTDIEMKKRIGISLTNINNLCDTSLKRINPDIIVTNTMVIPWGLVASHILKRPHVAHIREFGARDHKLNFYIGYRETVDLLRKCSNSFITHGEEVRRELFGTNPPNDVHLIYSYVRVPMQLAQKKCDLFKRTNSLKLLNAATLIEPKGAIDAVRAVRELVIKGHDVELIIAGAQQDQAYKEELEKIIFDNNLQPHIQLVGFLDNPYAAMNASDVVLVCSRNEAYGLVAIEAMTLKKPVIAADAAGNSEQIVEGQNGFLYEPNNWLSLAIFIEFFIKYPDKIKEIGEKGLQIKLKKYSIDNYGGKILKILMDAKKLGHTKQHELSNAYNRLASHGLDWFIEENATLKKERDNLRAQTRLDQEQLAKKNKFQTRLIKDVFALQKEIDRMRKSKTWQLRNRLISLPLVEKTWKNVGSNKLAKPK